MKKFIWMSAAAMLMTASIASAAGVNLSWDDCGTFGTATKTFACNSNSGAGFTMYSSFIAPSGINELEAFQAQVDITTAQAVLPAWWSHGASQCRGGTALSASLDFTTSTFNCQDFWAGLAASAYAYDVGFGTPNRARMIIQGAIPFDNRAPIDDVTETYGCKVTINRTKSTGVGSCAGCAEPACIVLNEIQLFQPAAVGNDPRISVPLSSNFVTWQSLPGGCPASTPTRNTTWGQVKSLYR